MTLRSWIFSTLTDGALPYGASNRVFAKRSMKSSVEDHPFVVYKLGNNTSEALSETSTTARQYLQFWVHDYQDTQSADYGQIDEVLAAIKTLFHGVGSPTDNVLMLQYLETSQDLNDETLGTVFKYARYFAILGS